MIKHVFIDMDGVLCDFISEAMLVNGAEFRAETWPRGEWSISKVLGITDAEFWRKIDERGEEFWANLKPYEWASGLVAAVQSVVGDEWSIATSPSRSHFSSSGKVRWLQNNFSSRFRNYHIGENKHRMAQMGHVLIDDSSANCSKFAAAGGHVIVFPQPWNMQPMGLDRVEFVREQLLGINDACSLLGVE